MAVLNPSAMLIVLVGTLGATITGTSFESIKTIPKLFKKAFSPDAARPQRSRHRARRLRRAGAPRRPAGARRAARQRSRTRTPARACSSSSTAPTRISSPTSSRPRTTRCASATRPRRSRSRRPAATPRRIGIIGTVFGLVHVLANLDEAGDARPVDLRGVHRDAARRRARPTSSTCPIASRLKQLSEEELHFRAMTLEGILAIQAGDNPRVVAGEAHHLRPAGHARRPTRRRRPAAQAPRRQAA